MTQDNFQHISVLLNQSIDALNIKPDGIYVDATFGRGGHSKLILDKLNSQGKLIVIDQDPEAIRYAQQLANISTNTNRVIVCHGRFDLLNQFLSNNNINKIDGILFDLGVSSPQLDDAARGFSFNKEGPLDMRMNNANNSGSMITAREWVNTETEQEIARVLYYYGDERYSRRIAKAIVNARANKEITTTTELAEIIKQAHPKWQKHKHPATKSFLAIRLFINKELEALEDVLTQTLDSLNPHGRLVVITFHSIEDRIVKNFMKEYSGKNIDQQQDKVLSKLPLDNKNLEKLSSSKKLLKIINKPIKASSVADEADSNIRARSAILRIAERL